MLRINTIQNFNHRILIDSLFILSSNCSTFIDMKIS